MSRVVRILASIALSAFFLYFAARGMNWTEVGEALGAARWIWIVPMVVVPIVSLVVRAIRWRVFVRPLIPTIGLRPLVSATAIGFAANMVLPLRAGEVVRPWVLARQTSLAFPASLATIALERLFDLATLVVFFAVASLTLPLPEEWRASGRIVFVTFAVFLIGVTAWVVLPGPIERIAERICRLLPSRLGEPLLAIVKQFSRGLAGLGNLRSIGAAVFWSLLAWVVLAVAFGFGFYALSLDVPFVPGALIVTAVVAIAVSVPGGPGFVGMFQAGCVVALAAYDVPRPLAFSYSILAHVSQFVATVVFGLYFFVREDLRITDVAAAAGARPPEDLDAGTEG